MSLNNASTVTVKNAIRKLVPKSICSTDDVKEAVKIYAEVTKENQRKVIVEAILAKSSKNVVSGNSWHGKWDFDSCWRVGKNDTMKKDYCRPLIIQMADMETVNEWTRPPD